MTKRLLITGATGFFGSHLAELCIEQGYEVKALVRNKKKLGMAEHLHDRIELTHGDLDDHKSLKNACHGCDAVVHAAGRIIDYGRKEQFIQTNVSSTSILLKSAQDEGVQRFIYISSPSVVAEYKDQINIDENYPYPTKPLNYYCETKAIAEQIVLSNNSEKMQTCALRPRGIWGPRDRVGFLPRFLYGLANEKVKRITGEKNPVANICHVKNACEATRLALISPNIGGEAFFISDNENHFVWDIFDRLAKEFNLKKVDSSVPPWLVESIASAADLIWQVPVLKYNYSNRMSRYLVGMIMNSSTYSICKAKKWLNYEPVIDFDTGLRELKDWINLNGGLERFLDHLNHPKGKSIHIKYKDIKSQTYS